MPIKVKIVIVTLIMLSSVFWMGSVSGDREEIGTRASVGTKFNFNETFNIDRTWNTDDVSVVVLVQSINKIRKNMNNDAGRQYDSYEAIQSTIDFLDTSVKDTGTQKRVLGECFTATWCGYCPGSVGAHDRLVNDPTYFPDHYTLIEWHSSSSGNGLGNADATARFNYYNWGGAIPFSVFDGVIGHIGGSADPNNTGIDNTYKGYINGRKGIPSPVSIKTFGAKTGGNNWINATIEVRSVPADELYKVSFVIVEDIKVDKNNDPWQGGNTSQAIYRYHARKVISSYQIDLGNAAPLVSIDFPTGGEVITGNLQINWTATDPDGDGITVDVACRKGSGSWINIATDLPNSGSYTWDTTTVDDGSYRIRVLAKDTAENEALADLGQTFEIKNDFAPVVTLIKPAGAEVWAGTQEIKWTATDDHDAAEDITIALHYSRDGTNFFVIYTNLENSGSYQWDTLEMVDDDSYLVRITARDSKGQETTDISAAVFELKNGVYEDSDGDGMPDWWEEEHDLDMDDEDDKLLDEDSDSLKNVDEYGHGTDPNNPDSDGDGMKDGWEAENGLDPLDASDKDPDPDADGLSNLLEFNHGTFPDDDDSDDDEMPDGWEVENDLLPMEPDSNMDLDEDGLSNLEEYEAGTDPNEADTDGDGMPDGWELEYTGLDPLDDSDGSTDLDKDNLTNLEEYEEGTDPLDADMDKDGLPDGWEIDHNLDPEDRDDALMDVDEDGLTNGQEFEKGTDPFNKDTDGDGMPDGWEVENALDPLDAADASLDPDSDNVTNAVEYHRNMDPNSKDTDGDGMPDGWEIEHDLNPISAKDAGADPDNDGMTNIEEYEGGFDPDKKDNPDDVEKPGDDDSERDNEIDPSSSDGFPWLIVVLVVLGLLVLLGGGVLALVMVLRSGKRDDMERDDELGRTSPGGAANDYESLYGSSADKQDESAAISDAPVVSSDSLAAPVCPSCGAVSVYYSEHDCHWCDPCQEYVYPTEPQAASPAPASSQGSVKVRRKVVKKAVE